MSKNILQVNDITMQFGGVVAVDNLSLEVNEGEIVALIGPNGAGKTTAFNCITGVYEPSNGSVSFCGKELVESYPRGKMKKLYKGENVGKYTKRIVPTPDKITYAGIARTFQNIRLFKKMTVLENVMVAFNKDMKCNLFQSIFRTPFFWKEEAETKKKAMDLLKLFNLEGFADQLAENLPYGKQRLLEIARALATDMKLLLLDEPAAGMNPVETAELKESIKMLREKFRIPILLIEHDMSLVMSICERIYVLNFGEILASGKPEEIANNKDVIEAYLGKEDEDEEGGGNDAEG